MYKISLEGEIPRREEIIVNGELWYLDLSYNSYDSRVYVNLLNSELEEYLEDPWPIVYGNPLFSYYLTDGNVWSNKFPKAFIIPNFKNPGEIKKIDITNYNDVELYVEEVSL